MDRVQKTDQSTITTSRDCDECGKQRAAITKLWSQVQDRAHPTNFSWHCPTCDQDRQLTID